MLLVCDGVPEGESEGEARLDGVQLGVWLPLLACEPVAVVVGVCLDEPVSLGVTAGVAVVVSEIEGELVIVRVLLIVAVTLGVGNDGATLVEGWDDPVWLRVKDSVWEWLAVELR